MTHLRDQDSYGNPLEPYTFGWWGMNWWVDNTGIAFGSDSATITGVNPGSTMFHLRYDDEWWYPDVWEGGWFCNFDPIVIFFDVPVEVQQPQVPTSLSVHTALSDQCSHPPTCQPPSCTGSCAAYYYKVREYQVMDGASPPQPINRTMTLTESFTTPQNTCNAAFVQGQATTNSSGIFKDTFFFFGTSICDGGGSCTVVRNQTWRENASNNNVASYTLTYTCNSFSIQ